MMVQAQRDMDVPYEPLGDFYWSMRIHNFVGAAGLFMKEMAKRGLLLIPSWPSVSWKLTTLVRLA
ncbi:hypothetical protein ACVBKF_31560, partial [Shewanella sp. 0m-11]